MYQSRSASLEIGEHLPAPPSLVGASAAGIWVVPTIFYGRSNGCYSSCRRGCGLVPNRGCSDAADNVAIANKYLECRCTRCIGLPLL